MFFACTFFACRDIAGGRLDALLVIGGERADYVDLQPPSAVEAMSAEQQVQQIQQQQLQELHVNGGEQQVQQQQQEGKQRQQLQQQQLHEPHAGEQQQHWQGCRHASLRPSLSADRPDGGELRLLNVYATDDRLDSGGTPHAAVEAAGEAAVPSVPTLPQLGSERGTPALLVGAEASRDQSCADRGKEASRQTVAAAGEEKKCSGAFAGISMPGGPGRRAAGLAGAMQHPDDCSALQARAAMPWNDLCFPGLHAHSHAHQQQRMSRRQQPEPQLPAAGLQLAPPPALGDEAALPLVQLPEASAAALAAAAPRERAALQDLLTRSVVERVTSKIFGNVLRAAAGADAMDSLACGRLPDSSWCGMILDNVSSSSLQGKAGGNGGSFGLLPAGMLQSGWQPSGGSASARGAAGSVSGGGSPRRGRRARSRSASSAYCGPPCSVLCEYFPSEAVAASGVKLTAWRQPDAYIGMDLADVSDSSWSGRLRGGGGGDSSGRWLVRAVSRLRRVDGVLLTDADGVDVAAPDVAGGERDVHASPPPPQQEQQQQQCRRQGRQPSAGGVARPVPLLSAELWSGYSSTVQAANSTPANFVAGAVTQGLGYDMSRVGMPVSAEPQLGGCGSPQSPALEAVAKLHAAAGQLQTPRGDRAPAPRSSALARILSRVGCAGAPAVAC
mmetsp:Transcript_17280/g.51939  ORF Transcript_17280/g.51939 Transcript_17280/m.51939 type:complete len:671 (-) Transcript_17280:1211-3223(-)